MRMSGLKTGQCQDVRTEEYKNVTIILMRGCKEGRVLRREGIRT